jgi:hypothetical protein
MQQHVLQSDATFKFEPRWDRCIDVLGQKLNNSDTSDSHRTVLIGLHTEQWQVSGAGVR